MVGPKECSGDNEVDNVINSYLNKPGVHPIGYTEKPEKYLALSDIHCLPSYREGFGTVVIEAAAMGLPTVGTQINGLVDAVENEVTGILVPAMNIDALYNALKELIENPSKRNMLAKNAKNRVKLFFNAQYVNKLVMSEYKYLLTKKLIQ